MVLSMKFEVSERLERNATLYPVTPATPATRYQVHLFGPFCIQHNSQRLGEPTWRRDRARTLLKWFLLNPGRLFSVDQLCQICWPGAEKTVATRNLHVAIHYLRRLLEPDLSSGQESSFIRRNKHNFYWFELDESWWIDAQEVQHLALAAEEAQLHYDFNTAIKYYRRLVDYYARGFLPEEIYEDVFSSYRRQHDYAYTRALEKLLHLCIKVGRFEEAFTYASQLMSVDPYNEAAIKAMANIYYKQGNVLRAIDTLDSFHTLLVQELGTVPNNEIRRLRETIVQQLI